MPKLLSVITTVFNAEKYLRESLDSLFNQTFTDFEAIIVDDGSTDTTKEIIKEYLHHPNVIFMENKYNEGVPYSRNKALLTASGKYVAIHDADDVSLPYRFEKQINILNNRTDITFTGGHAIRISDTGTIIGSMVYPPETTGEALFVIRRFKLNPIIDPSSMFRLKPILDIGGYRMEEDIRTVQDFDLWCRLLTKGHHLYNIQEPLIKYRINPQGVTRQKKQEQVEATDITWAAFKRKSFPEVVLRRDRFQEDSESDFPNNK